MKHLIIIPGIGDDREIYHIAAGVFKLAGFRTHIHPFGWDGDPASYQQRMDSLRAYIAGLEGPVCLLGVSAGGPAAVSAFAAHGAAVHSGGNIVRVATLSAPLAPFSYAINPLLTVALEQVAIDLECMEADAKRCILSVHGLSDQTVPIKLSKPVGVRSKTIPSLRHAPNIVFGLTILALPLLRFLKQR